MNHERLAQGDYTLLGTRDGALEHHEVVLYDTVVRETTHRSDRLLSCISFSRSIMLVVTLANTVNLLVELRTVMVSVCAVRSQ